MNFCSPSSGRQKRWNGNLTPLLQPDQGSVCLPTMNYKARGGWKVSLCLAKDGRSRSFAQSTIYLYGCIRIRLGQLHMQCAGTITRTNRGRNVFLFPSKVVTGFILPKKKKTTELQISKNPWVLKYLHSYWIGWPENHRSLNREMGFL